MQVGVRLGGECLTWDDAFERCKDPLRPWPYTPDMLDLLRIDYEDPDREPGVESYTPTRILKCHREAVLEERTDYYVDPDSSWPLVRGHMVHALMERAHYPGALMTVREQRMRTALQTAYGPALFTGKPDLIVVNRIDSAPHEGCADAIHIKVVDYKSKSEIKHDLLSVIYDHELQVNMYAWVASRELPALLDLPGAEVVLDELEIDYVDMSRVRRFTSAGWLHDRGKRLNRTKPYRYETIELAPIHIWPLESVGRFVRKRIEERIEAHEVLPPCERPDDFWHGALCRSYKEEA